MELGKKVEGRDGALVPGEKEADGERAWVKLCAVEVR